MFSTLLYFIPVGYETFIVYVIYYLFIYLLLNFIMYSVSNPDSVRLIVGKLQDIQELTSKMVARVEESHDVCKTNYNCMDILIIATAYVTVPSRNQILDTFIFGHFLKFNVDSWKFGVEIATCSLTITEYKTEV